MVVVGFVAGGGVSAIVGVWAAAAFDSRRSARAAVAWRAEIRARAAAPRYAR